VYVPFKHFLEPSNRTLLSTEFFAPFQLVTEYAESQLDQVLEILEYLPHHLTASVCSNDTQFIHKVVSNSVNGVTYTGILSRTTGAPQNHYFGPAGDPRSAGIGTPEAIINMWTCHREIITDVGPLNVTGQLPEPN
jgi:1-pyrroline-5-carboxylate dehydrogenase